MSAAEWFALEEDVHGELVGGRLVEVERPTVEHELIVVWFVEALRAWLRGRGGVVLGSGVKYALGAKHGRKPDLSVFMLDAVEAPGA